jgi:hypothetical protein
VVGGAVIAGHRSPPTVWIQCRLPYIHCRTILTATRYSTRHAARYLSSLCQAGCYDTRCPLKIITRDGSSHMFIQISARRQKRQTNNSILKIPDATWKSRARLDRLDPLARFTPRGRHHVDSVTRPPHSVAAVRPHPLQHFKVSALRRPIARLPVPVAAVRPQPLQHFKVPAPRRLTARGVAPVASVRSRPLQHTKVPNLRRCISRVSVPVAAVRPRPPKHGEVPAPRRLPARGRAPVAAVRP